ncbi:unnamed protein product [Cuscuta epithymum]|uniref:Myb/SANT-like domain-containing protein n=1 Tax=Cuscuta epithymum TaxID=186058 RepID=A0AAV0DI48_9ASTE|nr:unnamed protein product [Cuscuta epithymum]
MTYTQYKSREKYFKRLYCKYSTLMQHNSGFGWDHNSKFFTASEEVWDNYFKSHPKDSSLRTDPHPDYEDLRIAVGNGTARGAHSIAVGDNTIEDLTGTRNTLDGLAYDPLNDAFVRSSAQHSSPPSPEIQSAPQSAQQPGPEVCPSKNKRSRTDFQKKPMSIDAKGTQEFMEKLTENVDKFARVIESIDTKEYNCWDMIKEIPSLCADDRFRALDLLNTKAKKAEFVNMTAEDRAEWISYKLK